MIEIIFGLFITCFVGCIIMMFTKSAELPTSTSQAQNEQPVISFWASMLVWFPRPSGLNPTMVHIYDDHILINNSGTKWIVNKENYIEFKRKGFFQPCTIKIRVNTVYKYEKIQFAIISKKNQDAIEKFLEEKIHGTGI